jgi:3-methyladenine DNA glycosylase AlkD
MGKYYKEILEEIKKRARSNSDSTWAAKYLGTSHLYYGLSNPIKREIAKVWAKNHKDIQIREFIDLLDSLYTGKSYDEKAVASYLLVYLPDLRKQLKPILLDNWLNCLSGWAEVDSLCQSNFSADEILFYWDSWKSLLIKFSKDKNISKKRASLVLLTKVVYQSSDSRLSDLAFEIVDRLKQEKDILITKAISWILRDLTYLHSKEVEKYLKENENTLPKIAIRETRRKLLTGRK